MKIKIISQVSFVTNDLVKLIKSFLEQGKEGHSSAMELELAELTKFYLRKIAQGGNYVFNKRDIFEQASNITEEKVQNKLKDYQIQFDFTQYFVNIKEDLKYPVKELTDLKGKLLQSREVKRIGEKRRIDNELEIPVEIIELGLRDYIEGLVAFPLVEECEIDLKKVKENYEIEDNWFPYELNDDGFTFVLDDGTIFISTENFPRVLIVKVREKLEKLARHLYAN